MHDLFLYLFCCFIMGIKRCMTLHHDNAKTARSTPLPQWGAADAEIKVPSGENTELKRSPFKAWSRSVYNLPCYAYCQGFLPCYFLPFWSIHLHFFQNLSRFLLCWLWLTHGSCVGPKNNNRLPCWMQILVLSARDMTYGMMTCEMNNLEIE